MDKSFGSANASESHPKRMFNNNEPLRSTTHRNIRRNPEAVLTRLRLVYFGAVARITIP
jgi:hypothetical protein